jgi:hypothetical protein
MDIAPFYGRRRQLGNLLCMLQGQQLMPMQVFGLRRSGKTSFLHHVTNHAREEYKQDRRRFGDGPVALVYVDMQRCAEGPSVFYETVVEALAQLVHKKIRESDLKKLSDFRMFSRRLEQLSYGHRLVVLLDNFEILTRSPRFEVAFFLGLRSLVTDTFVWITASTSPLVILFRRPDLQDYSGASSFPTVFCDSPIILGGLDPDEADELVSKQAASRGAVLSESEKQAIQTVAGRLPIFLQAAANMWLSAEPADARIEQRQISVLNGLLQPQHGAKSLIAYYWHHLSDQEQDCLHLAASDAVSDLMSDGADDTKHTLLSFGLLEEHDGQCQVSGELVRRCLLDLSNQTQRLVPDLRGLRAELISHYNLAELETLCFDLDVDWDDIVGPDKASKTRNLIEYLRRRDALQRLLKMLQTQRPNVDWAGCFAT